MKRNKKEKEVKIVFTYENYALSALKSFCLKAHVRSQLTSAADTLMETHNVHASLRTYVLYTYSKSQKYSEFYRVKKIFIN